MQYLLTEDEMEQIRQERRDARQMPNLEGLTNMVKHISCNMIDTSPPNGRAPQTRPHGCIHVADSAGPGLKPWYCDFCSVSGICPLPKDWSK